MTAKSLPHRPKGRGGSGECPSRSLGKRLKAVAADLTRLLNSPTTWRRIFFTTMKTYDLVLLVCFAFLQTTQTTQAQQEPVLLTLPPDETEGRESEAKAGFRPAVVEKTTTHYDGKRHIIVQLLAPDPRGTIVPAVSSKPSPKPIPAPVAEVEENAAAGFHLQMIAATVFPGPFSRLAWTHNFPDGTTKEVTGWSNVDFNHFAGINTIPTTDGEEQSFVMAVSPAEGDQSDSPPPFPGNSPRFIPDLKNAPAETLLLVNSLHKLYKKEGSRLASDHARRVNAQAARDRELLANPPGEKDLIIRYRIAETPLEDLAGMDLPSK